MKKIFSYFNTMYKPSFRLLSFGLGVSASLYIALAVTIHNELLTKTQDIIHKVPEIIEAISFPTLLLIAISVLVDVNERKRSL